MKGEIIADKKKKKKQFPENSILPLPLYKHG